MTYLNNPWRGKMLPASDTLQSGDLESDDALVQKLLAHCPAHGATPLVDAADLARELGVGSLHIKDERPRMGLGSFKALGAAFAIAKRAYAKVGDDIAKPEVAKTALAVPVH